MVPETQAWGRSPPGLGKPSASFTISLSRTGPSARHVGALPSAGQAGAQRTEGSEARAEGAGPRPGPGGGVGSSQEARTAGGGEGRTVPGSGVRGVLSVVREVLAAPSDPGCRDGRVEAPRPLASALGPQAPLEGAAGTPHAAGLLSLSRTPGSRRVCRFDGPSPEKWPRVPLPLNGRCCHWSLLLGSL